VYTITITTESRSVHEYLLDEVETMKLHPKPTIVSDMGYTPEPEDTTLPERVHDALRAAGQKSLADEYADANGAGR